MSSLEVQVQSVPANTTSGEKEKSKDGYAVTFFEIDKHILKAIRRAEKADQRRQGKQE